MGQFFRNVSNLTLIFERFQGSNFKSIVDREVGGGYGYKFVQSNIHNYFS